MRPPICFLRGMAPTCPPNLQTKFPPMQSTSGILLPYLLSKQPVVTWKTFGFALTHLITSNSFALPLTNITPLLLLLRNASSPLILLLPLQTLANFGIPSTLFSASSFTSFFLTTVTDVCHFLLRQNSQTAFRFEVFFYCLISNCSECTPL